MKVSVLIPAYNAAPYLGETLQSVLRQSHANFEVIVVNDCSTDDTVKIANSFSDPRIRVVSHIENRGPSAGVNSGMQHVQGELIALLDADDLWSPDKLAQQVKLFEQVPTLGACYTDYSKFGAVQTDENGFDERGEAMRQYPRRAVGEDAYVITSDSFLVDLARIQAAPMPSAVMFRTDILRKVLPLDESIGAQDVQITFRLANQAVFGYIDRPLMQRRLHASSWGNAMGGLRWLKSHSVTLQELERWTTLNTEETLAVRKLLRGYLSAAAYTLFTHQQFAEARRYFAQTLRAGFQWKTLLYWLVCFLPPWVIETARRFKQRLSALD